MRRIAAPALAVLTVILAIAGLTIAYVDRTLFDADHFADHVVATLDDEAVRDELSLRITEDLILSADQNLVAFQPVIQSAVSGVIGGSAFQSVLRAAVSDLHRSIFEQDPNTLTLTLVDVGTVVHGALAAIDPKVAADLSNKADATIVTSEPPDWLLTATRASEDIGALRLFLLIATFVSAVLCVFFATDRRRAIAWLGGGLAFGAIAAVVTMDGLREILVRHVEDPGQQAALEGIWNAFLDNLRLSFLILASLGVIIAAATTSLIGDVPIEQSAVRAFRWLTTVPERRWLRALRALLLIAAGVLVVLNREFVIDLIILLGGAYLIYKGVEELLAMMAPERQSEYRRIGGRAIAVIVAAVAIPTIALAVFVGGGVVVDAPAAEPGCNGSDELCDRALDEVAFASTHNAMSGAGQPDYLFAQQDAAIPDQLGAGIRGLLIDAHYGVPTTKGGVATDLSDVPGSERKALEEELGQPTVDAALRLRDRIGPPKEGAERSVYLCHGFCELGALDATKTFKQIADFLERDPSAVLVIIVEDYVTPEDLVASVEAAGLDQFAYTGDLDPEALPTLGEIVDSGGRALFMAENNAGAAPWYHPVYEELVQETPYHFTRASELTDPGQLEKSCRPNRGPETAPLFLMNHWIDTSPAPRPSNAQKVNTRDALLTRAGVCAEDRGLPVNFVAVDFFATGDLFGAVDALNEGG